MDDTVALQLNKANNDHDKCLQVWQTLRDSHGKRQAAISTCILLYEPIIEARAISVSGLPAPSYRSPQRLRQEASVDQSKLKELRVRSYERGFLTTELDV